MTKDFKPLAFPDVPIDAAARRQAIDAIASWARAHADAAMSWYFEARRVRRVLCRVCRLAAVLLTAFAGLIPVLMELYPALALKAQHATLCLGLAALWVALDRFWGFTSGWVRYLQTGQQIGERLTAFDLDMAQERIGWAGGALSDAQAAAALLRVRALMEQVQLAVSEETRAWAAEFAEAVKSLDAKGDAILRSGTKAMIQVEVVGGDRCPDGWTISVDGGVSEPRHGTAAAVAVSPGLHRVSVAGAIEAKPAHGEAAIDAKAGTISTLKLALTTEVAPRS